MAINPETAIGIGVPLFIIFVFLLIFVFGVLGTIFWIWMLVDAVKRENYKNEGDKTIWILVIALTQLIGAIVYYFVIKRNS